MALLATLAAVTAGLGAAGAARLVRKLETITADWERHGGELPAAALAARRFLRPAAALLRRQLGGGR